MTSSKRSNVFSKGQGGANFEFRVQSAFLINMIVRGTVPSFSTEKVQLIEQQSDFCTDDLYVELSSVNGRQINVLVQIKHNLIFSEKNDLFFKVIDDAWKDFNSTRFDARKDKILIVKGNLSNREYGQLVQMLEWAEIKVSADDFFKAVQSIKAKEYYLNAFEQMLKRANGGEALPQQTIWEFLKCFRVIRYDFNLEGGTDLTNLLNSIEGFIPDNSPYSTKQIWDKVFELIAKSDSKGGSFSLESLPSEITDCFKSNEKVDLFVHHKHSPPLSFDYFLLDGEITKSYTEEECKFKVTIENHFSSALILDSIAIQTIRYKKVDTRILRLHSVKGRFVPDKFLFTPSKITNQLQQLLAEDELYEVLPNRPETIIFELDKKASAGYYELQIVVSGHCGNEVIELKSKILPLSIARKAENRLTLETMKFYESPVEAILGLENKKWKKLKQEERKDKYLLYLGQTINTMIDPVRRGDAWKIKGLKKQDRQENTYAIDPNGLPKNFLDLGIPIEEELFSMNLEEKKFIESIKKEYQ